MKCKVFILYLLFISSSLCNAAIITVDNKTPSAGQYKTIQEAHDAANNGDTVFIYPSAAVYSAITVSKKLTIVGTGMDRPDDGMNTSLISGTIIFVENSSGSILEGFGGYFNITIQENSITIQKNRVNEIVVDSNNALIKKIILEELL